MRATHARCSGWPYTCRTLVRLYWRLFVDRRVGLAPKAILVAGLVYFICPLDLIPIFP